MKRTRIAAGLAALLLSTAGCGLTGMADSTASDDSSVGIGTAVTVERDCAWASDQAANLWLSDELVARCDYRVTGQPCEEDELCAVQQIRDTGDFKR